MSAFVEKVPRGAVLDFSREQMHPRRILDTLSGEEAGYFEHEGGHQVEGVVRVPRTSCQVEHRTPLWGTSPRASGFESLAIPLLSDIPIIGRALFDQSILVYLMYALFPITFFVVYHTPFGLRLRATGEVPEAVDTAGVSVTRMRYYGVGLSGVLAALGGVYLSMGLLSAFAEGMTYGRGFIALAALIFGRWNPIGALALPLLFGFAQAITFGVSLQAVPIEFIEMLPYLLTIIILAGFGGCAIAPTAIGKPYRKE